MKVKLKYHFLLVLIALTKIATAQFIQNASFDETSGIFGNPGGFNYSEDPTGPAVISDMPGWTIQRNTYTNNWDYNINGQPRFVSVSNGDQSPYLTLNPRHGAKMLSLYAGGISDLTTTTLTGNSSGLISANDYELTFWYAGMYDAGFNPVSGKWLIEIGGNTAEFDAYTDLNIKTNLDSPYIPADHTFKQSPWKQASIRFTARNTVEAINLIGIMQGGPAQLFLDNLTVTQLNIPEPSSALLAILGSTVVLRRRRK